MLKVSVSSYGMYPVTLGISNDELHMLVTITGWLPLLAVTIHESRTLNPIFQTSTSFFKSLKQSKSLDIIDSPTL